ncbi:MAG: tetratricopeptide repeat protein [Roseiarcus sp.]
MSDIFVSYTSSDREWAHWIGAELKALGHEAHVHDWEIERGADILAWMEKHLESDDHVLCVVSDEYLRAHYSMLERNAALWKATKERANFALFVVVKPCKLPALVDHLKRCELFGLSDEARRERFRAYMRDPAPPAGGLTVPTQVFALSNIPIRVPEHFLGREDALAVVDAALKRHDGRVAITALHGLRGVGKTTLAAAFADRHRVEYRATWWIRAQTESTMRADLVALGVRLGWVAADEKEEPALARVSERLRHEGEGLLLIYDNAIDAESLRPYLPPAGGARVLVTSNARVWRGIAAPVEIAVWPKEIGADYLIVRTGRDKERADAEALSVALGGLPLAHEQAAAYCDRLEIALAEYRRRFEAAPTRLLDDSKHAPAEYGLTVAKTFALAIEKAAKLHPAAEPLIAHAALLAPEPIPLFLFTEGREKFGEPLASLLADSGLEEALAALRAFALVDRETIADEREPEITTETIRLHRLVREVAAGRCVGEAREEGRRVWIEVLAAVYPSSVDHDPKCWPRARRLDALAFDLAITADPLSGSAAVATSYIQSLLGAYRWSVLGSYQQAQFLHERALGIRLSFLGREHPDTARSLNDLAVLKQDLGDLVGALSFAEQALAIRERTLGPEHPEIAVSLNNVGHLLKARGEYASAVPFFEHAVAMQEKTLGSEHPHTAIGMSNLAALLQDQGDLPGARVLCERALGIFERLGPEHPYTATSLNFLSGVVRAQGDLESALRLTERALAIYKKTIGPEHPYTATTIGNLASQLHQHGDRLRAGPLFKQALAIFGKTLGDAHPQTNVIRRNLARLCLDDSLASEALALAQTALTAHERASGLNHPSTQDSARVTADALDALGRADESAELRARYGLGGGT